MDVSINVLQARVLKKEIRRALPTEGRSAFSNKTITRLTPEDVSKLHSIASDFDMIDDFKEAMGIPPPITSFILTVEEFRLIKKVMLDEDSKL